MNTRVSFPELLFCLKSALTCAHLWQILWCIFIVLTIFLMLAPDTSEAMMKKKKKYKKVKVVVYKKPKKKMKKPKKEYYMIEMKKGGYGGYGGGYGGWASNNHPQYVKFDAPPARLMNLSHWSMITLSSDQILYICSTSRKSSHMNNTPNTIHITKQFVTCSKQWHPHHHLQLQGWFTNNGNSSLRLC